MNRFPISSVEFDDSLDEFKMMLGRSVQIEASPHNSEVLIDD